MLDFLQNSSPLYAFVILPLFIFLARVMDVSIGTIRIVAVSRGMRNLAPLLGFFEIFIWIIAIGQIMQNLNNIITYFAYAGGFAAGTYVGLLIEQRVSMGTLLIRVITRHKADDLIQKLKEAGYGATVVNAMGEFGPVHLLFSVVRRKQVSQVIHFIKEFNPRAFYTIEDVRFVNDENNHLAYNIYSQKRYPFDFLRSIRKGK